MSSLAPPPPLPLSRSPAGRIAIAGAVALGALALAGAGAARLATVRTVAVETPGGRLLRIELIAPPEPEVRPAGPIETLPYGAADGWAGPPRGATAWSEVGWVGAGEETLAEQQAADWRARSHAEGQGGGDPAG